MVRVTGWPWHSGLASRGMNQEELVLAAEFPTPAREQWQELIAGVLRKSGKLPDSVPGEVSDLIATRTYDDILVHPLYTGGDTSYTAGMPGLAPFVRGGRPEGNVATGWDVRQRHANPDP